MTTDDTKKKDAVLLAMLPEVPFDGWSRAGMRKAAARAKISQSELDTLFPRGTRDVVAWFSRWADRETLAMLATKRLPRLRTSERIALGVKTRLQLLLPHREAVRRAFSLLALACGGRQLDRFQLLHKARSACRCLCRDHALLAR